MTRALVVNAGSSSIKFGVFEPAGAGLRPLARGRIRAVERALALHVEGGDGQVLDQTRTASTGGAYDPTQAITLLFDWIDAHAGGALMPTAVGHRVVHGGAQFVQPLRITEAALQALDALVPLAPLHQPHNLRPIHLLRERWPGLPQVACFDTAFHATLPPVARACGLPRAITDSGVRRYGFHGLSYEFVASRLPQALGEATAAGRVIVAHLGNGASLCALAAGRSVATTMGFSVLDGLLMGTRCGSLDAGVLLYLMQHDGMTAAQLGDLLYERSGLLGVSGVSSDMDVLLHSADPHAAEAVDLFVYRVVTEIGALAAALGGLDALVFTAGIGENAAAIRARICEGCGWLGAALDDGANGVDLALIHTPGSALPLAVIPTDEEWMIAVHTVRCVARTAHPPPRSS